MLLEGIRGAHVCEVPLSNIVFSMAHADVRYEILSNHDMLVHSSVIPAKMDPKSCNFGSEDPRTGTWAHGLELSALLQSPESD